MFENGECRGRVKDLACGFGADLRKSGSGVTNPSLHTDTRPPSAPSRRELAARVIASAASRPCRVVV